MFRYIPGKVRQISDSSVSSKRSTAMLLHLNRKAVLLTYFQQRLTWETHSLNSKTESKENVNKLVHLAVVVVVVMFSKVFTTLQTLLLHSFVDNNCKYQRNNGRFISMSCQFYTRQVDSLRGALLLLQLHSFIFGYRLLRIGISAQSVIRVLNPDFNITIVLANKIRLQTLVLTLHTFSTMQNV